jgi:hypothetical protein
VKLRQWHVFALSVAAVVAMPICLVVFQTGMIFYDRHRVASMCAKIVPGTTLEGAKAIITAAGVGDLLPRANDPGDPLGLGGYDATERNWFFAIPVAMEYGDERCGVYHNGKLVLKAEMELL